MDLSINFFNATFTFPSMSFPSLSVEEKVTYFAQSQYSDFLACDAFNNLAFSTSLLISKNCFYVSLGLKLTTRFSLSFTVFFRPVAGSVMT